MDPFFHTGLSISDSLKTVRKSVLIYETIISAQGAINLTTNVDTSIDYGQGFSSVTFIPAEPRKLSDIAVMHLSVGKENAGKVVYLYAQNLATMQMELKQTCIANEIGNVMYETEEYSNIVLLYR